MMFVFLGGFIVFCVGLVIAARKGPTRRGTYTADVDPNNVLNHAVMQHDPGVTHHHHAAHHHDVSHSCDVGSAHHHVGSCDTGGHHH
jgi:hypothetical protein